MLARAVLTTALLACFAALAGASDDVLQVRDTWIRDAPPTARMRSAYAVLINEGASEIEVVSASSPDFGLVEMHETRIVNDIAKMMELPSVKIAPRAQFAFRPSGAHFMLMQPKREFRQGDRTTISLTLTSGAVVEASFVVGPPPKPKTDK